MITVSSPIQEDQTKNCQTCGPNSNSLFCSGVQYDGRFLRQHRSFRAKMKSEFQFLFYFLFSYRLMKLLLTVCGFWMSLHIWIFISSKRCDERFFFFKKKEKIMRINNINQSIQELSPKNSTYSVNSFLHLEHQVARWKRRYVFVEILKRNARSNGEYVALQS